MSKNLATLPKNIICNMLNNKLLKIFSIEYKCCSLFSFKKVGTLLKKISTLCFFKLIYLTFYHICNSPLHFSKKWQPLRFDFLLKKLRIPPKISEAIFKSVQCFVYYECKDVILLRIPIWL